MSGHRHKAAGKWTTTDVDPDVTATNVALVSLNAQVKALEARVAALEAAQPPAPGVRSTFTTA